MNAPKFSQMVKNGRRAKYMLSTMNGDQIMQELKKTKRYELLPFLVKALDLKKNQHYADHLSKAFGKAAAEGDLLTSVKIWRAVKVHLNAARISYHYGLHCKGSAPPWLNPRFYNTDAYLIGLIATDNLEFFVKATSNWPKTISNETTRCLRWHAGLFCAKKMMTYFGFSNSAVKEYLDGAALSADASGTLNFLVEVMGGWFLGRCYKENLALYGSAQQSITLFHYFLKHDYMSFTEEERALTSLDFASLC